MKYTREDIVRRFESEEELLFVLFWGHTAQPGKISKACFSQWYPVSIIVDGVCYCCNEQFMMAQKALLFGDRITYDKIMAANDPKEIKSLGREVSDFDQLIWDENKYQIVLKGNLAKFFQNEELKKFLLETGNTVIAEASPYDTVWGIGMSFNDPQARDPRCWKGENLLGFALMEVRDFLLQP